MRPAQSHLPSRCPLPATTLHLPVLSEPRCSCVPSAVSPEAGLIYVQGVLLVLRTLLSDYVSKLEGRAARWAIQSNAPLLSRTLGQFVAVRAHVPRLRLHFGEQGLHSVSPAPHCEVPW